jgi:hypothetical protein
LHNFNYLEQIIEAFTDAMMPSRRREVDRWRKERSARRRSGSVAV